MIQLKKIYPLVDIVGCNAALALRIVEQGCWAYTIASLEALEATGLQLVDLLSTQRYNSHLLLVNKNKHPLAQAVEDYAQHKGLVVSVITHLESITACIKKWRRTTLETSPTALRPNVRHLLSDTPAAECLEQIVAYFQPQHDAATKALYGAEILARWQHPIHGLLEPVHWLPIFHSLPLRNQLWDRMLDQCLNFQLSLGNQHLTFSVNVTADVACSTAWAESVSRRILASGLSPAHLTVEVTEDLGSLDEPSLAGAVSQLRLRGIGCAIDDFGIGFSSLKRLSRIPFVILKVDQTFIRQARGSDMGHRILSNTITMAHDLGLSVTAEGIETEEDLERVVSLGCDIAQGYYFAKPMPAEDFIKHIKKVNSTA